jgi:hypothetical protein
MAIPPGNYPLIKKWLGYRESRRRDDEPLSLDEVATLRGIVQRVSVVVTLQPQLDETYERAAADATRPFSR